MATLQERNGSFRVLFCYNGKRETFTLGNVSREEAEAVSAQVDYLLMRIEQRFVVIPHGTDIVAFIRNDGKPDNEGVPAQRAEVTLGGLRDRYLEMHMIMAVWKRLVVGGNDSQDWRNSFDRKRMRLDRRNLGAAGT
jgi:hypothetical protein